MGGFRSVRRPCEQEQICLEVEKMRCRHLLSTVLGGFVAVGAIASSASAAVVYHSLGFEPPVFAPGVLEGQDPLDGPWQRSGLNNSTATVQTAVTQSGLQAVKLTRANAADADARWAVVKPQPNPFLGVQIDWDMYVEGSTAPDGSFGPFIGVEAYDALDNAPLLAGSLGVDAKTGDVLYQAAGSGVLTETGTVVPFNQWNHFTISLDYANDQYSVLMNGVLLATEGFVDPGIDDFTDAPLALLAAAGDPGSLNAGGTGYIDNYAIQTVVPEPASAWVGIMVIGLLGRATARRRAR
jgi:hypothetical protein